MRRKIYYIIEYLESSLPNDVLKKIKKLRDLDHNVFKHENSWFLILKEIVEGDSEKEMLCNAMFNVPNFYWESLKTRVWLETMELEDDYEFEEYEDEDYEEPDEDDYEDEDEDEDEFEDEGCYCNERSEDDFLEADFKLIKIGERYFGLGN
jgi:hypothetical protein